MTTTSVRRAAALAVTFLIAALLAPMAYSPATADASDGVPGPPRVDAASLALGYSFGCVIVEDGSVRCWGSNGEGQLVQGNTDHVGDGPGESTVRLDLGPGRTAVAVSAGYYHACAILDTGQVRCWGYNTDGQLAQGHTMTIGDDPGETTVGVDLGPGRTAVAVSTGDYHACAILDTGQVRCWGENNSGQLGQGNTANIGDDPGETTVSVDLGLGRRAVAISAGGRTTCAILDTGQLRCWGNSSFGQLMQGTPANIGDSPGETTVPIDLSGQAASAVSVGAEHVCAVRADGGLRCWGNSASGQLGLGRTEPFGDGPGETAVGGVDLPAGRTALSVTTGERHSCAILDSGDLRCWGYNTEGQLGQGNTENYGDQPGEFTLPVSIDAPVHSAAAGGTHTCAVTGTGLRCWGDNFDGQLGRGNSDDFGLQPGQVPAALPPISLGGLGVGRDSDGDGIRDAVDACPAVAGLHTSGCPAVLTGKKVVLNVALTKTKASAKCPAKAEVKVKTKTKKGKLTVTKMLKTKTVTGGCAVKGKVKLSAKPKKSAKTKVKITGTKLKTKRLVAVKL
jgi:alpha-tubulin suppressor-like RCC1 family protein